MPLTDEQRETFLDLTRRGWNRGAAAKEIGTTGTRMRRMIDETCVTYDHEFALAYLDALANVQPDGTAPKPRDTHSSGSRTHTSNGRKRWNALTEEEIDSFLERVSNGEHKYQVASDLGTSLGQIERLAANDPDFAAELAQALESGYPLFVDWMRSLAVKQAEKGDYKALRDLLVVHAPEYAVLRTTRHEVGGYDGGAIQVISEVFPSLPSHVLDGLIEAIEQKQIDARDVIDMIPQRTGTDG
jgi:hypothetical protein